MISASAPGKAILFGEHAVVHGRPALAVPVTQVQATARLEPGGEGFWIEALGRRYRLADASGDDPIAMAVRLALERAGQPDLPAGVLRIESTIPVAAGLGSGAAVCTATVRAVAQAVGVGLGPAQVSALVYQTETILHGTPSGIDNTVVAFGQPVYFIKGQPPQPFRITRPFDLLIADTGVPSPTRVTVADVRAGHAREPERYDRLFDEIGAIVERARADLEAGTPEALGPLMNRNHALLQALDVSSPDLDRLAALACQAGALGAKLSGGGRGGNLVALVEPGTAGAVRAALEDGGAVRVIGTMVK